QRDVRVAGEDHEVGAVAGRLRVHGGLLAHHSAGGPRRRNVLNWLRRTIPRGRIQLAAAASEGGAPRVTSRSYSARMIFSIRSRVSLLSGWAMSLNVPSLRRFAGMATNSPVLPLITLRSRTTKHASNVMVTYAFRRSSFTGKTRTSVISMEDPSRMTPRPMLGRYLPANTAVKPSRARLPAWRRTFPHGEIA